VRTPEALHPRWVWKGFGRGMGSAVHGGLEMEIMGRTQPVSTDWIALQTVARLLDIRVAVLWALLPREQCGPFSFLMEIYRIYLKLTYGV